MNDLKAIFSKNLYTLRMQKKLTQFELGALINYSDKAVSRWERGEAMPDIYVLMQLSEYFGVSIDYMLTSHNEEDETKQIKSNRKINFNIITYIVLLGIFTIALIAYTVLHILEINEWMIFIYALPIALITSLILNTLWNQSKHNMLIISALIWSIIISLYLSFLAYMNHNWWIILLVGIPAQIITLLCFKIKIKIPLDILKKLK